jgi:GT2 family glycosyltransferase
MKIAAVIVTYNRVEELQKTITAIVSQGIHYADIFIINNNSSDQTKSVLNQLYPNVNAVHLEDNIASAGGFSLGMKLVHKGGYNWAWLFNDDSRPVMGSLESIRQYLIDSDQYKLGLLKIGNINEKGQAILLYWKGVRKPIATSISNKLIPTDLITFDGCMISTKLMDVIGYCDPLYFMGTYEFDYCLKAKDAGFGIFTVPNGLIEDRKMGGEKGTPPWRQYYNTRNHLWLGLNRRSIVICKAWLIREIKYTYSIIRYADNKADRFLFKFRAVRDAIFNRRGKRYRPEDYINSK